MGRHRLCWTVVVVIDVAIIAARGGSQGLPGKNIRPLGEVPLIQWTIAAAQRSGQFRKVIVTTDDEAIADAARNAGADIPFIRPDYLSTGTATSTDVILHALSELGGCSTFALLQPTSPFRSANHIKKAIGLYMSGQKDSLVSIVQGKPIEWSMSMTPDGLLERTNVKAAELSRRQDGEQIFYPNGAMYITQREHFEKCKSFTSGMIAGYQMSAIDSLDIDDINDFELAEAIVTAGLRMIDQ